MRIFYTNKLIFWSNEGNDYLERNKFDEYLTDADWTELSNTKSINWTSHYTADFYASDNFEATYFKIIKNNKTYYFFIQDIRNDSGKGKFYYLTLDFYYTYVIKFIDALKENNPHVVFKRKHANRFFKNASNNRYCDVLGLSNYLLNVPSYLQKFKSCKYPKFRYPLKTIPKESVDIKDATQPDHQSHYINIDETKYFDRESSCYTYLIMKANPKGFNTYKNNNTHKAQVVYIPVKNDDTVAVAGEPNTYTSLRKLPADYIIGMIETYVPPSFFKYASTILQQYKDESTSTVFDNQSIILFPIHRWSPVLNTNIKPFNGISDDYNIDNYQNEIMLHTSSFKHYRINEEVDIKMDYFLLRSNFLENITLGFSTLIGTKIYTNLNYDGSLYKNLNYSMNAFDVSKEVPFSGSVFNNYLLNNINSMNTGIAIAKRQSELDKQQNIWSSIFNVAQQGIGAAAGLAFGGLGGAIGGTLGAAYQVQGSSMFMSGGVGIANTIGSAIMKDKQIDFQYKSTIDRIEASKADASNRPNTMLDTYGDGNVRVDDEAIIITTYTLPNYEQKIVFSDFYFNGYLVNGVDNFNTYDNRQFFNYFEIDNAHPLVSQYLKLPKDIIDGIAKKVLSGIRLWKTSNFDYSMNLNNKEISYVER